MTMVMDWVETNLYIPPSMQVNILKTIFIIIFIRILYSVLKKLLYKLIGNDRIYYKAKKVNSFLMITILFILVGRIWFEGVNSFMTFVGLFSAALAIVMKDVIMNLAGWIYIVIKSPFKVGDRIEIDGISGDVVDIQLFSFVIMEIRNWIYGDKYTGRTVSIPNVMVFNESLSNFNSQTPYIWNELKISVPFKSDWEKAKNVLQEIVLKNSKDVIPDAEAKIRRASRMFSLLDSNFTPKVYTRIENEKGYITFIIRYICHYESKRGSAEKIYEDILKEFAKHNIEFAYPINRIYYENIEKE